MVPDRHDIERDIAHQYKMIRALRSRLQQRELQEAQLGFSVPPEIVNEIHDLTERIQRHELELRRLQTEAAVDQIPLIEAEYRSLLAHEWDTPRGRPTVAGTTRLELARLRLGISPQLAKSLEIEIRESLANEQLLQLIQIEILESLRDFIENQSIKEKRDRFARKIAPVIRTLRLHTPVVVPWLLQHLKITDIPNVVQLWEVFRLNPTVFSEFDRELVKICLSDLEHAVSDWKLSESSNLTANKPV